MKNRQTGSTRNPRIPSPGGQAIFDRFGDLDPPETGTTPTGAATIPADRTPYEPFDPAKYGPFSDHRNLPKTGDRGCEDIYWP